MRELARRFLVTGGAGFIGAALVRKLLESGHSVTILDNGSRGSQNMQDDFGNSLKIMRGDIRDLEAVKRAVESNNSIVHLAYVNGTRFFYEKPAEILDVAARGMLNLLHAARDSCVDSFYLASTSEVYQTPTLYPTPEAVPLSVPEPFNPRYSYGTGKILSEMMLLHSDIDQLTTRVVFRPHNVYGPQMGYEHVIPMLIGKINEAVKRRDASIVLQGDGQQTRSFIFIDDFVTAMKVILDSVHGKAIINVGTEEEISILELANLIQTITKTSFGYKFSNAPEGETSRRCPDTSLLSSFGFQPRVTLEEGLWRTVAWYLSQGSEAQ